MFICCGFQPVHGHGSTDSSPSFVPVKLEQGDTIHCVDDPVLSLASVAVNDYIPKQLGDTTIKGILL